jgi:cytochrome c
MGRSLLVAIALMLDAVLAEAGPVHDAARSGDLTEMRRLIREGADLYELDRVTGMPLHTAAANGHLEVAEILISVGARINDRAGMLRATPLHMAVLGGNTDLAALLLSKGADVDARDGSSNTPLHVAADRGHVAMIELLLSSGADLNARNQTEATPVRLAARADRFDIVELLIALGATAPPVEPVAGLLRTADPENGRVLFAACEGCHTIAKGGHDGPGPNLWDVLERGKARSPTFDRYSRAFARLEGTWTDEELSAFLASPEDAVPGTYMKKFSGLEASSERADVIAYLRENGDKPRLRQSRESPTGTGNIRDSKATENY